MSTYSCHIPKDETDVIDRAIAESPEGQEGPWLREAARQRLLRDGYVTGTAKNDVRVEAMAAADIVGPERVLELLRMAKAEASASRAERVP